MKRYAGQYARQRTTTAVQDRLANGVTAISVIGPPAFTTTVNLLPRRTKRIMRVQRNFGPSSISPSPSHPLLVRARPSNRTGRNIFPSAHRSRWLAPLTTVLRSRVHRSLATLRRRDEKPAPALLFGFENINRYLHNNM